MKKVYYPGVILYLILITACSMVDVEKPEGFAEARSGGMYHAVSPEGVRYRVRYVKNYPVKEIDFWQKALKIHLEKEGYDLVSEQVYQTGDKKGVFFEWGAPYGHENYIYMTAIAVFGKKIAIAEAAGEYSLFHKYKEAIISSLQTIRLR